MASVLKKGIVLHMHIVRQNTNDKHYIEKPQQLFMNHDP